MKKSLLLVLCVSVSLAVFAKSPIISAPGFKKHRNECSVKKEKLPDNSRLRASKPVQYANPPKQYVMLAQENETKGIRLLNTYEEELNKSSNREVTRENKYSYDEYGFFKKRQSLTFDEYDEIQYKWYVPGWKWSERKGTWYFNNAGTVYTNSSTIKRTFYLNGGVHTSEEYDGNDLTTIYTYDENGNLIKQENPNNNEVLEYTYFPLKNEWLESRRGEYYNNKWIVYDNYIRNEYSEYINDKWIMRYVYEYYFDPSGNECGNLSIQYDYEGEVQSAYGNKCEIVKQGDTIIYSNFSYNEDKMAWEEYSRQVQSENYNTPWVYNPTETRTVKYYYGRDELSLEYVREYSWIKDNIVKCVNTEFNYDGTPYSYSDYYMVKDQELDDDIYYDEKTGAYAICEYTEEDGKDYDVYSYFDASGKLVSKIRVNDLTWEQWDGSKWGICTSEVTVYEGSDYYIAKFNDKGQLIQLTEYEDGQFDNREDYVYIENGYERRSWEYSNRTKELYLYELYTYTLVNDVETEVTFKYNEYDEIYYAHKQEIYVVLGYNVSYYYDNGSWKENGRYIQDIYEQLPDGKQMIIRRVFDENGNVVNDTKEIYYDDYKTDYYYRELYKWNRETNSWVGDYKRESGRKFAPEFKVIMPAEPTYFNDEYFVPANFEEPIQSQQYYYYSNEWTWDNEKNDWALTHGEEREYKVDGNVFTTTTTVLYSDNDFGVYKQTITVDDDRRILSDVYEYKNSSESSIESKKYSYDNEGRLIEKVEDNNNWKRVYKYTYGEITYILEVEDIAADANDFSVNGKILSVSGDATAEVYNMQGVKIATVSAGNSTELPSGSVYIIKIGKSASKVCVK